MRPQQLAVGKGEASYQTSKALLYLPTLCPSEQLLRPSPGPLGTCELVVGGRRSHEAEATRELAWAFGRRKDEDSYATGLSWAVCAGHLSPGH